MTTGRHYSEALASAEKTPEYWAEAMALEFISEVWGQMQARGLSQSDLARMIDKKPALVSRVLSGPHNLTLRTMAEFLTALDRGASFRFAPIGEVFLDDQSPYLQQGQVITLPTSKPFASPTIYRSGAVPANSAVFENVAA